MTIKIPNDVQKIIDILEQNNFDAYVVGGCVRDSIIGLTPQDWDICTNATPLEIKKCLVDNNFRIIENAIKHGTISAIINKTEYQITTFRIDGNYSDNRRPDSVVFVNDLKQDLSRRDFAINAMAYNNKVGLVDFFDGRLDIANKVIRCVGDAEKRFDEDALRIMRALRFASVYQYKIDIDTSKGIFKKQNLLSNISYERFNVEFCKMLCGNGIKNILTEYHIIITNIIPQLSDNNNLWNVVSDKIHKTDNDLIIRLTMLFYHTVNVKSFTDNLSENDEISNISKAKSEKIRNIMSTLRFNNKTITDVCTLASYYNYNISPSSYCIKKILNKIGFPLFEKLLIIKKYELSYQNNFQTEIENLDKIHSIYKEIIEQKDCFSLATLNINGRDLIGLGFIPGAEIGKILNVLLEMVISNQVENEKNILIKNALLIRNICKI